MKPLPWLAAEAAVERDLRVRHYPDEVKAGRMSEEAREDIAAWRAIADLFAAGSVECEVVLSDGACPEQGRRGRFERLSPSWAELELAASRAFLRRCEACDADPNDARLRERRSAVQSILDRIAWNRWLHAGTSEPPPAAAALPERKAA